MAVESEFVEAYCDEIHRQTKDLYAAFPVTRPLELGDYGTLSGALFQRRGNLLTDFKDRVSFERRSNEPATEGEHLKIKSAGEVTERLRARAKTSKGVSVSANVLVSFRSKGAVWFNAAGLTNEEVESVERLGDQIIALFRARSWELNWYVITRLLPARSTTAAVSFSNEARLRIAAKGNVPKIKLADASIELEAVDTKNVHAEAVAQKAATPLMALMRLRFRWYDSDPKFQEATEEAVRSVPDSDLEFARVR